MMNMSTRHAFQDLPVLRYGLCRKEYMRICVYAFYHYTQPKILTVSCALNPVSYILNPDFTNPFTNN